MDRNKEQQSSSAKSKLQEIAVELEVAEDEIEKTKNKEIKETSLNIIIHGVEELMDMDPRELEYSHKIEHQKKDTDH